MSESYDCPQCGNESDDFSEGVCIGCCRQNQEALDTHNAEYDRWRTLTDAQKDAVIYASGRVGCLT